MEKIKRQPTPIEQIIRQRKQKARDFTNSGINPYPAKYALDKNNANIQKEFIYLEKEQFSKTNLYLKRYDAL